MPVAVFLLRGALRGVAGVALILTLTSCSQGTADTAQAAAGGAAPAGAGARGRGAAGAVLVTTATVIEKSMAVTSRVVGNVEASSTVDVRSQVTGTLLSIGFNEGDEVKAGQVLFTIDPRTFEATVKQAEATLARDTASAKNAEAQLVRQTDLFNRGLLSKAEFDTGTAQVASLTATLAADAATLDNAKLQLQYTRILAPVSGRTGAHLVNEGSLVRAADASPLVVINQMAPVFVSFAMSARLLPQLRGGAPHGGFPVRATPAGTNATPVTGTVSFIDNAVDPATDTVRVKATFANTDRRLWPGAFVDVTLQLSVSPKAIVVPTSAVQPSQQGQFVYVVKADQTVEARPIKVAWTDGQEIVVESGVHVGEVIVTDGQLKLTPGARVSVKPAEGSPRKSP